MEKSIKGYNRWEETSCSNVRKYFLGDFEEIIYVIKTGFKNRYIVISEDAYEYNLGNSKLMTKDKIERIYKIELDI
tara:strand:- start:28 stop:255 length:228 start_codon:yes stop_codon:yes gene_type:complete